MVQLHKRFTDSQVKKLIERYLKREIERPIVIVDWTNEEGSRFAPAMVGSGIWVGALDRDWVYNRTDINGKRFVGELEHFGYRGTIPAEKWPVHAYYEYHIEQGPILEQEGKTIGAPKGILCLHCMMSISMARQIKWVQPRWKLDTMPCVRLPR